jgi:hypothetical protein
MKNLLSLLLFLWGSALLAAPCQITFTPRSQYGYTPQYMSDQLTAAGWTVLGVSAPILNGTVEYRNVTATRSDFTYTYSGVTYNMCQLLNRWDIAPASERQALDDAIGTYLNFTMPIGVTVDRVSYDLGSDGAESQNYVAYADFINNESNEWVTNPAKFGYTLKDYHSNNGLAASATETLTYIDTSDAHTVDYPFSIFGHLLIPTALDPATLDFFRNFLPSATHASQMIALSLQVEGLKIYNKAVRYDYGNTLTSMGESVDASRVKPAVMVLGFYPKGDADTQAAINIKENKLNASQVVVVEPARNQILKTYAGGSKCVIGNVYIPPKDLIVHKTHAACFTQAEYFASNANAIPYVDYWPITQAYIDELNNGDYFAHAGGDNPKSLTVGFISPWDGTLGNYPDPRVDFVCNFGSFSASSSSLCAGAVGALATVIVKENPSWTAQCVIDAFIGGTKQFNRTSSKSAGVGYGVFNADAVINYSAQRKNDCGTNGLIDADGVELGAFAEAYPQNATSLYGIPNQQLFGAYPYNFASTLSNSYNQAISNGCTGQGSVAKVWRRRLDPITNTYIYEVGTVSDVITWPGSYIECDDSPQGRPTARHFSIFYNKSQITDANGCNIRYKSLYGQCSNSVNVRMGDPSYRATNFYHGKLL